jgi:hypothetical protein
MEHMATLLPGQYVLAHKKGESALSLHVALEEGQEGKDGGREVYDLHTAHLSSGATSEEITYIPVVWTGPPTQIPYTFTPSAPPRVPNVRYCYAFVEGCCPNPATCPYPHLTIEAVQELALKQQQRGTKRKQRPQRHRYQPDTWYDPDAVPADEPLGD